MTTAIGSTTTAVLAQHVQALISRNLDSIVQDYAEDAVILSPNGVFKGQEPIRLFFSAALNLLTPEALGNLKVFKQQIDGEYAYILWSAGTAVPFAGDTFQIHDGKIVMQSVVQPPNA